jgi:hypothetical protein
VRDRDDTNLTPLTTDWGKVVLKERFQMWTFGFSSLPELIAEMKEASEFPMCDRTPVNRWSFGRVTLFGCAASLVSQYEILL